MLTLFQLSACLGRTLLGLLDVVALARPGLGGLTTPPLLSHGLFLDTSAFEDLCSPAGLFHRRSELFLGRWCALTCTEQVQPQLLGLGARLRDHLLVLGLGIGSHLLDP